MAVGSRSHLANAKVTYNSTLAGASFSVNQIIGEQSYGHWVELDRLLVRLWRLQLARPKALYSIRWRLDTNMTGCLTFLAGGTGRGIADLAEWRFLWLGCGDLVQGKNLAPSSKIKTGLLARTERAVAGCKSLFRVTVCVNWGHHFKMQSIGL